MADSGNAVAQLKYAAHLIEGANGHPTPEAIKYLKLAVEQGNSEAETLYASYLALGDGVPEDQLEAAKYFKRAADKGHKEAQGAYADILQMGVGVPQDLAESERYRKLAEAPR
jgi:TPR repeat protein